MNCRPTYFALHRKRPDHPTTDRYVTFAGFALPCTTDRETHARMIL
jgi:hypothetical protein